MLGFLQRRSEHPRIGQIRQLGLFSTLNPKELRVIDGLLHERRYLKGEIVFDEGEEGQALYVVLSGRIAIYRQGRRCPDAASRKFPQACWSASLALLDDVPRTAQARAAEDCVLAALSRAEFQRLMETHAAIASKIALQLARDLGQKLVARVPARRVAAAVNHSLRGVGPAGLARNDRRSPRCCSLAATKALWLVVPLLVAIILYYMLFPVVRRLIARRRRTGVGGCDCGGRRDAAYDCRIMFPLLPWLATQSMTGEATICRYLEGGRVLIERTLATLESSFAFLRRIAFPRGDGQGAGGVRRRQAAVETRGGAAGGGDVPPVDAARPVLRVFPAARWRALRETSRRRGAERVSSSAPCTCSTASTPRRAAISRGCSSSPWSTRCSWASGLWIVGVPSPFVWR